MGTSDFGLCPSCEAIARTKAADVSRDLQLRRINRIHTIRGSLADLLAWLGSTGEHPLVASSVFHYEFEFIHPFEDGNGRMGRLWQTLILTWWKALFAHIPIESLIHTRQGDYYRAIRQSSAEGASTSFVALMLDTILEALRSAAVCDQAVDQVARLIAALQGDPKTTAQLMAELGLSHRPTFRNNYIHPVIAAGVVEMTRPESPTAKNQTYRLTARGRDRIGSANS